VDEALALRFELLRPLHHLHDDEGFDLLGTLRDHWIPPTNEDRRCGILAKHRGRIIAQVQGEANNRKVGMREARGRRETDATSRKSRSFRRLAAASGPPGKAFGDLASGEKSTLSTPGKSQRLQADSRGGIGLSTNRRHT
jgi:hypothetical protein